MTALWHNQAHMPSVVGRKRRIVRGEGAFVYDEHGRRLLDVPAGLWFANVGHGRLEIADAVHRQMVELETYPVFGAFSNLRAEELADRLSGLVPMADAKVFFSSGGSDAVDTAVKLIRRYWDVRGQPERQLIVTRDSSYHGLAGFGTSIAGVPAFRAGYGPLLEGVRHVPAQDSAALAALLDGPEGARVAAFFCEPVIGGGGGVVPPTEGYLEQTRTLCRERGVLFVADEVICGFGRTGSMFASDRYAISPDLLLVAKGVTSGYVPLGACIVSGDVAEPFFSPEATATFAHGLTYSGHAVACAAAMANLDILEREGLVDRVRSLEDSLLHGLQDLGDHPAVKAVRGGVGLLAAVAFHDHDVAESVAEATAESGLLMRVTGDNALQISPPFVADEADLDAIGPAIRTALERVRRWRS